MQLTVNGKSHSVDIIYDDTPLLWVLRDNLGLVGTKFGCGMGQCGACTVHIDGETAFSCLIPAAAVVGRVITTIEGLATSPTELHPLQRAWIERDVAQCGYCQSGQIMRAAALLARNAAPTAEEIDTAMAPSLCRCGTYVRIRAAIQDVVNGPQGERG
jgi:isoquinoline 1-oxidoreductase alpha subunit